jgi:competence protein ComEC
MAFPAIIPAVLSSVLWRTAILRATALPLAALGLLGAAAGPSFDMAVAPAGDAVAFRAADGRLAVIGRGRNAFSAEQWLRADADGRLASEALTKTHCDKLGCVGYLASGRTLALVLDTPAFAEDCTRADRRADRLTRYLRSALPHYRLLGMNSRLLIVRLT